MKKEILVPVVIVGIIALLVVGYLGRHKIKTLLGMNPTVPAVQTPSGPTTNSNSNVPSNSIYMTKTSPSGGNYMTDFNGITLYVFDRDTTGVSNCNGSCATTWPAYTPGATAQGTFPTGISVITRADGSKQFAWNGKPLYYYSGDTKAGDMNGDGIGGIWHIVKL